MSAVQSLQENGYVVLRGAVSAERCQRALEAVDSLKLAHPGIVTANADEFGHLYRVVNLHRAIHELADAFASNDSGLAVCDAFFGEPASLYTSLYYERGSEQALHRDTPYFCTRPAGRYLGVWLALDDVDSGNGPLKVVPKSHLLPPIDIRALRREVFGDKRVPAISELGWNRYQAAVQKQCDERSMEPVEIHVCRGDVIIWHPEMFHGGSAHLQRERSRRSLVMHVTPEAVPVYHIDVFFDPDRRFLPWKSSSYEAHMGRKVAKHRHVDFGHKFLVKLKELRRRDEGRRSVWCR